jgi:hypothetical protein
VGVAQHKAVSDFLIKKGIGAFRKMECSGYCFEMHCGHIFLYNIIPKYTTKNLAVLYVGGKE